MWYDKMLWYCRWLRSHMNPYGMRSYDFPYWPLPCLTWLRSHCGTMIQHLRMIWYRNSSLGSRTSRTICSALDGSTSIVASVTAHGQSIISYHTNISWHDMIWQCTTHEKIYDTDLAFRRSSQLEIEQDEPTDFIVGVSWWEFVGGQGMPGRKRIKSIRVKTIEYDMIW